MIIKSQDKQLQFIFENLIGITPGYLPTEPEEYPLLAVTSQGKFTLGTYLSKDFRVKVQDEITAAFERGQKVYQLPAEPKGSLSEEII